MCNVRYVFLLLPPIEPGFKNSLRTDRVAVKPLTDSTKVSTADQRIVNSCLSKETVNRRKSNVTNTAVWARHSPNKNIAKAMQVQLYNTLYHVNLLDNVRLLPLAKNAMHLRSSKYK